MHCAIEDTLKHVLFLAKYLNHCDLNCMALVVLIELWFSTKMDGFDYLQNAIVLRCHDPTQRVTKSIYITVGQGYSPQLDKDQVEFAIRSAIVGAWKDRDESTWRCYFPVDRNGNVKKPTNAEFISRVARILELWQGCCKEVGHERA